MKLNWFSPLPPARSAIASYAAAVVPELGRHAEVTVWREGPPSNLLAWPESSDDISVRAYRVEAPSWPEINRADVSIFHIGNDARFHASIHDLSRDHPGIVVLHDARLQEFAAGMAEQRNAWERYAAAMRRHHGTAGALAAQHLRNGTISAPELVAAFPLTAAFVDRALGIVVHSEDARQMVAAVSGSPVLCTPLPYRATRADPAGRSWHPPFRLIMFGFLSDSRGLDIVLAVLAALPERDHFHLDIYGDLPESALWRQLIEAAGLGKHITVHGFVSDTTLAEALNRAHLALNLRDASRGEASFSLLQGWDHGLATIVSRIGWFGEIPATCVAFAHPDRACDDVAQHLQALLADPEVYRRMGIAGKERLRQHHNPRVYAERVARFAADAAKHRNRSNALHMADRAATALRDVGGRHVDERILEHIGSAVHALTGR